MLNQKSTPSRRTVKEIIFLHRELFIFIDTHRTLLPQLENRLTINYRKRIPIIHTCEDKKDYSVDLYADESLIYAKISGPLYYYETYSLSTFIWRYLNPEGYDTIVRFLFENV